MSRVRFLSPARNPSRCPDETGRGCSVCGCQYQRMRSGNHGGSADVRGPQPLRRNNIAKCRTCDIRGPRRLIGREGGREESLGSQTGIHRHGAGWGLRKLREFKDNRWARGTAPCCPLAAALRRRLSANCITSRIRKKGTLPCPITSLQTFNSASGLRSKAASSLRKTTCCVRPSTRWKNANGDGAELREMVCEADADIAAGRVGPFNADETKAAVRKRLQAPGIRN